MTEFANVRQAMVENQIRSVRVDNEDLLEAMREVPRELFVPEHLRGVAYVDEDIRIDGDRYLTEPMVLARLLQAGDIGPDDAVLVIGCTTGYSVAVTARLAAAVVGLDGDADMIARAEATLARLEIYNGVVVCGDMRQGWPQQAPYDVIVIEGRCDEVPRTITEQLSPGGRLVTVFSEAAVGRAVVIRRDAAGSLSRRSLFDAFLPPLDCFRREPEFRL